MHKDESKLWPMFVVTTCIKVMLVPAYHSTDFEVHRNWLAITYNLPLKQWYYDETSEWTLDYPPFFAYFEWLLAQVAKHVDPNMLILTNLNYVSKECKYFQRCSVMFMDLIYLWGVWRCIKVLRSFGIKVHRFSAEALLIFNIGLLFVDHIHFQYNGFLFGMLLLSISYLLEERMLMGCFLFACLLNFKHIFLYIAPPFGIYLLRYYCLDASKNPLLCLVKLLMAGLTPFVLAYGPFHQHLPQVFSRLFPFKRGLTHAYWAPNFWALYNTVDKVASKVVGVKTNSTASFTSGLVQEYDHAVLPNVQPLATFVLTVAAMIPILWKLWTYTSKRDAVITFLRSVVICSICSFMFGWHVHEKAILMSLIPFCFLFFVTSTDAKYSMLFSAAGYFSLFPLLFHIDLLIMRASLFLAYMGYMYLCYLDFHKDYPDMSLLEDCYIYGLMFIPTYEHIIGWLTGLNKKLPFLPLLMYSTYCAVGRELYDQGFIRQFRNILVAVGMQGVLERFKYMLPRHRRDLRFVHEISERQQWIVVRDVPGEHYVTCTTVKSSQVVANVTCRVDQDTRNLVPVSSEAATTANDASQIEHWLKTFFAKVRFQRPINCHISFRLIKCKATGEFLPLGIRLGVSLPYICYNRSHAQILCRTMKCVHMRSLSLVSSRDEESSLSSSLSRWCSIEENSVTAALDKREALFTYWDPLPYCAYYHFQLPLESVKTFLQNRHKTNNKSPRLTMPSVN